MTVDERMRRAADELRAEVPRWSDPETALERVVAHRHRPPPRLALVAATVLIALVVGAAVLVLVRDDDDPVVSGPPAPTSAPRPTTPGPATGESAGLPMTVDPASGLEDGDEVRVTVEGLPPELEAGFLLCRADALQADEGMERCQLGPERELRPAADGSLEGTIAVERLLTVGRDEGPVDCSREVRCAVGVVVITRGPGEEPGSETVSFELRGLVAVDLAPQEPLATPTVRVTPAEGLRHGQVVTISGDGFTGPLDSAALCAEGASLGGSGCTYVALTDREQGFANPEPDGSGHFEVEVPIWRVIPGGDPADPQGLADCAEVACTLVVEGGDDRSSAPIPVAFDASTPPPTIPTLRADPTEGLRPGDPVTVTVDGLADGQEAFVVACASDPSIPGGCRSSTTLEPVVGDADGSVSVTIPAVDPASFGLDCREAGRCAVTVGPGSPVGEDPVLSLVEPVPVRYAP
jgi:hypothetical protein